VSLVAFRIDVAGVAARINFKSFAHHAVDAGTRYACFGLGKIRGLASRFSFLQLVQFS